MVSASPRRAHSGGAEQLTAFDSAFHRETRARDMKSLLREREKITDQKKIGANQSCRAQTGRGGIYRNCNLLVTVFIKR